MSRSGSRVPFSHRVIDPWARPIATANWGLDNPDTILDERMILAIESEYGEINR
jgi:hypothetical protein